MEPTSTPTREDRYLTRAEVASMLRLKEHTLAVWACKGGNGLPFVKVGRRVLYRESDVRAFLEANRCGV